MKTTLMAKAREVYVRHNFEVLTVSKRFENVPHGRDRGDACIYILRSLFGLDWEERVNVRLFYIFNVRTFSILERGFNEMK
jgi:hypothetical protein